MTRRFVSNSEIYIPVIPAVTTLKVDIDTLRNNVSVVQTAVGQDVAIIAVVKSDGYGLGQIEMAQEFISTGVASVGVATTIDALTLRSAQPDAAIMLIYPVLVQEYAALVAATIEVTVTSIEHIVALDSVTKQHKKSARVHIQVETGMNHYGADHQELLAIAQSIDASPLLTLAGVSTHFASAGTNSAIAKVQYDSFIEALALLAEHNICPEFIHCANSASVDTMPKTWQGSDFHRLMPNAKVAIRIGSLLYGLYSPITTALKTRMVATQLITRIVEVKQVAKGQTVGYFGAYTADNDMRIGVLPIGWGSNGFFPADGFVVIDGVKAPVVGSIGANTTAVDITKIEQATVGQSVLVLDTSGENEVINLQEVGARQSMFTSRLLLSLGTAGYRTYVRSSAIKN